MEQPDQIARVESGIPGLDQISHGGLPEGRVSLIAGTAGSGKTVFASQFLVTGAMRDEPGVFVTFEESPGALRTNLRSFGWDIPEFEDDGAWSFVDASPDHAQSREVTGQYDLSAMIVRVERAIEKLGARRVAVDSIATLLGQFDDPGPARNGLFLLASMLNDAGVTTVMTAERNEDYGDIARFGFEEFVADNVLLLRNPLADEKRRRTIEILKMRGGSHAKGEHLFTLGPRSGIAVVPNAGITFDFVSSWERRTSGNAELDEMLNGGLFDRSLTLLSGPTGTGKSLLSTQYIAGGVESGERTLLHSFEESAHQIKRNARAWGYDFDAMEESGSLKILAMPPESRSLEEHLLELQETIEDFGPDRVAIDSLTALERISTVKSFREYVLGLTYHMKSNGVLGLFTAAAAEADNDITLTDLHVSTITDTIILLQYVGIDGRMHRGLNVLKMRGSDHEKRLREFTISDDGLHIHGPFKGVKGMLTSTTAEQAGHEE